MASPGERLQTFARVVMPGYDPMTGQPIPHIGLTAEMDLAMGPNGAIDSGQFFFEELGDGFYAIYLDTLEDWPYGQYEIHFHFDNPDNSAFTHTWELYPRTLGSGHISRGLSRRQIRERLANSLHDLEKGQSSTQGDTNSFTDPINFARETDYFKGMQVWFSNPLSPNYDHIATVTRSDGPTRTIYFEPPLQTAGLIFDDTVDLYNFRGRGATISQYNAAINDAIAFARDAHYLIPVRVPFLEPFVAETAQMQIPSIFVRFAGVEYVDHNGYKKMLPYRDYKVDIFSRTIELRRHCLSRLDGVMATMRGFVSPPFLEHDDDRTLIDSEWLFNEARAQILFRHLNSGMPVMNQDRLWLQERTEAGGKRGTIVTRMPPNTIELGYGGVIDPDEYGSVYGEGLYGEGFFGGTGL